jgi:hypothetical protein
VLSEVSSDFNEPSNYPVRLSYRWVKAGSVAAPLAGFDTRTPLPEALWPGKDMAVTMEIQSPPTPGKYWLEIEAVQELVAWFKEKGHPGIRFEVEVRDEIDHLASNRPFATSKPTGDTRSSNVTR